MANPLSRAVGVVGHGLGVAGHDFGQALYGPQGMFRPAYDSSIADPLWRAGGSLLGSMEPYPKGAPGGALGTLDPRTRQGQLTYAGMLVSALMEGSRGGRLGRVGSLMGESRQNPMYQHVIASQTGTPIGTAGYKVRNTPAVQAYLNQLRGGQARGVPMAAFMKNPQIAKAMMRMGYSSGNTWTDLLRSVESGVNPQAYGLSTSGMQGGTHAPWEGQPPSNMPRVNPILTEYLKTLRTPYGQN